MPATRCWRGKARRVTHAPPMAGSAGVIQCAAAMVVTSGNGGLEMTKTKAKRQTVGDCEGTLRALELKRKQVIARGESLPELRRGAADAVASAGGDRDLALELSGHPVLPFAQMPLLTKGSLWA